MTEQRRGAAWLAVALLWLCAVLNYIDRLMITSMRDAIKADLPMTDAQFGLLTAAFLWIYGVASPFCGFLADRYSRKWLIVASIAIWSAVTWWTGHARSYEELLLSRALMGISEACYVPAALALICDHHRGPTRSRATGIHGSGLALGAALGGIGGYLAEWWGWRNGFSVFGIFGVVYAVTLGFLLREAPANEDMPGHATPTQARMTVRETIVALGTTAGLWAMLLAVGLGGMAAWAIAGWMPTYLREHFGLGLGEAGLSATAYVQGAAFLGFFVGGWWADRWSRNNPRGRLWVPAVGYAVAAPCLFFAADTDVLLFALTGLSLYGLGRGMFDANIMPVLREFVPARASATAYGCVNFVSCVTGGLATYAGGALMDADIELGVIFRFAALALIVIAAIMFWLRPLRDASKIG